MTRIFDEVFLEGFLDKNPNPVIRIKKSRILFANPAARNILKIKEGENLSGRLYKASRKAVKTGNQIRLEESRDEKTYLFIFEPLKKKHNVIIYAANISSLKKTESKLKAANQQLRATEQQLRAANRDIMTSEKRYRSLFEKSKDPILTMEPPEWNFTSANPAALKLFGISEEKEIKKENIWKLSPKYQPDRKKSQSMAKKMIKKAMKEGSVFFEWQHKNSEGKEFPSTVLLSRVNIDNKSFLLATVRDITIRKQDRKALMKRLTYERLLVDISSRAVSVKRLESFLSESLDLMADTVNASRCYIYEYDDMEDRANCINERLSQGVESGIEAVNKRFNYKNSNWIMKTLNRGDYFCFNDTENIDIEELRSSFMDLKVKSVLVVPLLVRDSFYGFLGFDECNKAREWQKEDINYFLAISRIISGVIEQKQAEDELRRANNLLDSIVENIPNMMLFLKEARELRFVRFNKAGEELLGFSREDLYGKNDYDFFPKEQADFFTQKDYEVLRGKKAVNIPEEPIKTRHRGLRILHTRKVPILNEKGEAVYLLGISEDITERKKAERELSESEFRFRTLADSGNTMIWTSREDRKRDYFNKPWLDFTGRSLEQELGDGWTGSVHPDDLIMCLQTYMKSFEKRKAYHLEYRLRRADGKYRWILVNGKPRFNKKGKFLGYIGHCVDITDRKRAEDRIERQAMLNSLVAGISSSFINVNENNIDRKINLMLKNCGEFFKVDRAYFIRLSNDGMKMNNTHEWCRDGISPQKDTIQEIPVETMPWFIKKIKKGSHVCINDVDKMPDIADKEKNEFKRQKIKSMMCVSVKDRFSCLNGFMGFDTVRQKKKWEEDSISLLKVLANIASDAFENVNIQQQMAQAQKMETVGRLAGGIASDFDNILSEIMKNAGKAAVSGHESEKEIEKIKRSAEKLSEMTFQLQAFAEKQPQCPIIIDVDETVKGMKKMLNSLIGDKIKIAWNCNSGVNIKMDPEQLNRILVNFTVNSREAISGRGRVSIETSCCNLDEDFCRKHHVSSGKYVKIKFSDNGRGIPQEVLPDIFDPFFSGKETERSTGLGLATVYGIVRQNKGFIEVSSEPEQGTTFDVFFPVCEKEKKNFDT